MGPGRGKAKAVVPAAGAVALAVVLALLSIAPTQAPSAVARERPNVIVVMTDDQDQDSLEVMTRVRRRIAAQGVTFRNAFTTTPLCCPSRASFFTGQYAHNNGVLDNGPPDGGYPALDASETLPVWLRRGGYVTAHVGKFLNKYGDRDPREVPQGWDEWYAAVHGGAHNMYDYRLNENGTVVEYGSRAADYKTDVLADRAVEFVRRSAPDATPFFLSVAPTAPHLEDSGGLRPARRHRRAFEDRPIVHAPSYNEKDVSDKPSLVRKQGHIGEEKADGLARLERRRWRSLLAVDELVARLVAALSDAGELDETLIVFTSDNGFLLGEHRLTRKHWVYEESVGVPLIIRGPGIPAGRVRHQLAANIDLAPTILHAAGLGPPPGHPLDGISLLPLAADPAAGPRRQLIFELFNPGKRYAALRTDRYVYVRHQSGERELYDLRYDRHQLDSRHTGPAYASVRRALAERLGELRGCTGQQCSAPWRLSASPDP